MPPFPPWPVRGGGYQWRQTETSLALCHGEKTVWKLVANPKVPKSYFYMLASVDDEELTAFHPADHPWHHGLWSSWKMINGLNYWEEDPKTHVSEDRTELTSVTFKPAADFSAHAELSFSYHPPGQPAVMTELRKLTITQPDADSRYRIDWTSEFTAGNARWMDFSSPSAGIAICDHPDNLGHLSPWYVHDRAPMSYFSPAVLFNKPLVLDAGQSLKLRYRILIHSKPISLGEIETESRAFVKPANP